MKELNISEIIMKMIDYSKGNLHDINHFIKVHTYAKTISECERISPDERKTAEIAAIIHDIACPLCREKYGNTNGKYQEAEGVILAEDFLKETGLPDKIVQRVIFLVGHHHTYQQVDGIDYQILLEADYLVNAEESGYSKENISHTMDTLFKTPTGTALLKSIYGHEIKEREASTMSTLQKATELLQKLPENKLEAVYIYMCFVNSQPDAVDSDRIKECRKNSAL